MSAIPSGYCSICEEPIEEDQPSQPSLDGSAAHIGCLDAVVFEDEEEVR